MESKVSVIVPVFRVEAYLPTCVDSILGQTYRNIELILVDDGSDDGCPAMCDAYAAADARVRCIHKQNGGLSSARNAGVEAAVGDYAVFVDSDDWLDTDAIRQAVALADDGRLDVVLWSYKSEYEENSFPRILFEGGTRAFDENESRAFCRRILGPVGDELTDPQKVFSYDTAWGKLYRMEMIRMASFVDTKEIGTEDALYNVCVFSRVRRLGYVSGVYYHYRKTNQGSLTAGYKRTLVACWDRLYDRMYDFLMETGADESYFRALQNRIALSLLGVGLNEVANPDGFRRKSANLRAVLGQERWRTAVRQLDISRFPLKWRVFYRLSKWRWAVLLTALLYVVSGFRARKVG